MVIFNFKIHFLFGVMIWVLFVANNTIFNPIFLLIAAVFPDADHKQAPIGRIIPLWLVFKHRTWVHSIWGLLITALLITGIWSWWSGLSWAIGFFAHLFLDACTPSGINWLGRRKKATR